MTEETPLVVKIIMVPFVSFVMLYGYLLFAQPKTWVKWFVAKPYDSMGISVSVTDERKLRRVTRIPGLFFLIVGCIFIVMLVTGVLK